MNKKIIEKKIDIARDEQGYLWASIFLAAGGGITIYINCPNIYGAILCSLGVLLGLVFTNAFFTRREEIFNMLKQLKEKE